MLNTWDFKPERESQAIKEYLSHVLLNGKLENTHIERIELQGRMVSAFIFDIPKDPLYFYVIVGVLDQDRNLTCVLLRNITDTPKRYNHNRYNITTMKKKDLIYIPHQDTRTEHFPNPGSNKKDYTYYLSDPQAQYNKLLRTPNKLKNKKK